MENTGIYCLYFEELQGKYYIGYSTDLSGRYIKHCNMLKNGTHHNKKLQKAYNQYGLPTFDIVELCSSIQLVEKELHYIKLFDSFTNGFNATLGGDGCGYGEEHVSSGYSLEEYTEVLKTIADTDLSLIDISEACGVSYYVVRDISCGKAHGYLKELFPEEYQRMLDKNGTRDTKKYGGSIYISILETLANTTMSMKEVSNHLQVSYSVVRNLAYGTNHKHLQTSHEELYRKIKAKRRLNIGGKWITQ